MNQPFLQVLSHMEFSAPKIIKWLKAFFDILEALAKKYNFYDEYIEKYGTDHLLNLAKDIKKIVDDKAKYAAWSARDDIKAELKVNIILKLAEYNYPPVTQDEVYKEVLE